MKIRNPVPGAAIPFSLACTDIDPVTGERTKSLCKARQEAHPTGQKKPFFVCRNPGRSKGHCSTIAFLYPRRWEAEKEKKGKDGKIVKTRRFHNHQGIDLFGEEKEDIFSVTAGTVHAASGMTWMNGYGGYGLVVVIKSKGPDGKPLYFLYAHCNEVKVKKGDLVVEKQVIATVGTTAFSKKFPAARFPKDQAHLHFEVSTKPYPLGPSDKREAGDSKEGRLDPRAVLESLGPWGMTKVHLPVGEELTRVNSDDAHKRVESSPHGGFFPLGANNLWHGGIHFTRPLGSTLIAPFDATIVAARLDPDPAFANRSDGSTNFILLRHEIPETYVALFGGASPEDVKPKPIETRDRAVGRKKRCANSPDDVIEVKNKLFEHGHGYYEPDDLTDLDDGSYPSKALKKAIKAFQNHEVPDINPDGVVDIPGKSWSALHYGSPPKEPEPEGPTDPTEEPDVDPRRVVYSLLMHLQSLAMTNKLAKDFPWLAKVELALDPDEPDPTEEEAKKAEEARKREHAEDVAEAAHDLQKAVGAPNADLVPAENFMPDVFWVHQRLIRFGFHPGPATATCDEALISAIREFQNQHHSAFIAKRNGDGRVDPSGGTVKLLRKPKAELTRGGGGSHGPTIDPVLVHRTTERDDDGVAKVITGLDVKVSSGDALWRSGQAMGYAADEFEVLEMREQVHWEIFSEHLLVRGLSEDLFAKAWEEPIIDTNEDMIADVPKHMIASIESVSPEFARDGSLSLEEVRSLYSSGRGKSLRRTPCFFISQWALDVEKAVVEIGKMGYDTKDLAKRLRPSMWWDQAKDVLPEKRFVWHYNPIEFLAEYAEHLASMRPPTEINLETHPTLVVRVLYENGTGMPDATVELLYGIEVKRTMKTSANGEAEFSAVEVGGYGVRITDPTVTAPIAVELPPTITTEVEIPTDIVAPPLPRGAIRVIVRKHSGYRADKDTDVWLSHPVHGMIAHDLTNNQGEARFEDIAYGEYSVKASTSNKAGESESVAVTLAKKEKKAEEIVLPRPFAFLRMTLEINKEPTAGKTMEIRQKDMTPVSKETDAYGHANFELPVGGGYTAWVDGHKRGVSVELDELNEFTLRFNDKDAPKPEEPEEGVLAVMVLDDEDDVGLGGELVFVSPQDDKHLAVQQYTTDEGLAAFELPVGEYLIAVRDESVMQSVTPWSTTSVEMEVEIDT